MKRIFFIVLTILITFVSCGPEVQINSEGELANPPVFTVEFDNEEFIADVAVAYLYNGVIIIVADKHDTFEQIVIELNSDVLGSYSFTPLADVGNISYKKHFDPTFKTNPNTLSGRVDITNINSVLKTLDGDFSLVGTRFIQQFDILGNPITDINNDLVFVEHTKIFTNGFFENIAYLETDVPVDTNVNDFFVKADLTNNSIDDGLEYVEDSIEAHKTTIGTSSYIIIKAKKQGFETITFKIPGNIVANTYQINDLFVFNSEVIGTYIVDEANYYSAVNQVSDLLVIENHNQVQKTIKASFNFDATHSVTGDLIHFHDGAFEITYTEE
ncbi:MAG: DUF6252 family protein [Flavobacteriaceae bacterium]